MVSMKWKWSIVIFNLVMLAFVSCSKEGETESPLPNDPKEGVILLPLVIHVVHNGHEIGEETNLSIEQIERQIEILNEDFRRKEGTKGFNDHPDGGDAMIEFVLAKRTPEGLPTNGINRIDTTKIAEPLLGHSFNDYAKIGYWDPTQYINVWIAPLPESFECILSGQATGPETDLPGTEFLSLPGPGDAEGIIVNWKSFGESDTNCHTKYGRTLTHEMGHYLGLLHTWGASDCENNDYCDDTPAVDKPVFGSQPFLGCKGETVMMGNYMNWSHDEVMNIFTKDQIARMHYVLENHEGRKALQSSPALD
ncbi:M43 family zinc metalloprotease [Allomuricauda sp. SCSIO 65647]|uniref:M43 family zinc metalloprotease n=1 Tax=Allomuricauda sp. SCSIO 65647 TaxID=2908843 RepID=UPI001EED2D42|nr:M43 family zinc metalloprotease [Muricauda sp. SCSIO 65647]UJH68287.1 hypothetical protein L0P89_03545 [Muricauda sp. SCSIO 65647]